jgi:phosphoribosylamine--glycine ligase
MIIFKKKPTMVPPKILVSGPSAFAAQLEGSKDFSKAFMQRHGIPTAGAFTANKDNLEQGLAYLRSLPAPYVLKADGLAAGKGVIITESLAEAEATLSEMILGRTFGAASEKVLIEEFLKGIEISVFAVCDGKNWKMLASAKDYKRIGEGDTGPNTGGMGAISPVPFADEVFLNKVANQVAKPTFEGLAAEGHPFKGFLFIGLMNDNGDPKVIEFNVRMGDPETEAIFPRLKTDMVDLLTAIASDGIETLPIELDNRTAATVFLVSKGYPGTIEKGKKMHIPMVEADCTLFHAGTALNPLNEVVTNGGRVLAITALGNGIEQAKNSAMKMAELIDYEGKTYRTDIGLDLINYQKNQTNG